MQVGRFSCLYIAAITRKLQCETSVIPFLGGCMEINICSGDWINPHYLLMSLDQIFSLICLFKFVVNDSYLVYFHIFAVCRILNAISWLIQTMVGYFLKEGMGFIKFKPRDIKHTWMRSHLLGFFDEISQDFMYFCHIFVYKILLSS